MALSGNEKRVSCLFHAGRGGHGDVDLCLMNPPRDQDAAALQTALRAAHENERRWLDMSAEFSSDSERMEQWRSTAKLRRIEIERIQALLASDAAGMSLSIPASGMEVEFK